MDHLRAGAALFNAGHHLAAHEPWEERWLEAPRGARDDRLQGLIQATAAIHKARTGDWTGAVGLADGAVGYLGGDHDPLRRWLRRLAADPELAERERPPPLSIDGAVVTVDDLRFPAAAVAAEALAETRGDDVAERAVDYARSDVADGDETSPFVRLTLSYVRDGSPAVRQRLADHVRRRRARDADVEGLFDPD